jgi:hypothetical protein
MSRSKGGSVLLDRERYFYENSFLMDDQNKTQVLLNTSSCSFCFLFVKLIYVN